MALPSPIRRRPPMSETALTIEGMGRRGEGVAHRDDRTVFVPGTLPDERVVAAGDGDRLALIAIERASPDRIEPFCGSYGRCGGCQLQHWRAEPYRVWKASLISEQLKARGLPHEVSGLLDAHGAGRRRVSLHVRKRDGLVTAGFMEARTHTLLDIARCPILEPDMARAFDIGRAIGARLSDCDVAITSTQTGLDVSVRAERKFAQAEHAKLAAFVTDLRLARLSVNGEVIATAVPPRLEIGKASVALPPGGFLQATVAGEAILAKLVTENCGPAKRIADLFCGVGPFALRLAERASIMALDNDKEAIDALLRAATTTTGLKPIAAEARDLFRRPLMPDELKPFDGVVFDPSRQGAEAQARELAASKVPMIVGVSCNPVTFARDARILVDGGYRLTRVTPVDQFHYSMHVELVARFER